MLLIKEVKPKAIGKREGQCPRIIGVRLSEDDYQMFVQLAELAGLKPSQMAQTAVLNMIHRLNQSGQNGELCS